MHPLYKQNSITLSLRLFSKYFPKLYCRGRSAPLNIFLAILDTFEALEELVERDHVRDVFVEIGAEVGLLFLVEGDNVVDGGFDPGHEDGFVEGANVVRVV